MHQFICEYLGITSAEVLALLDLDPDAIMASAPAQRATDRASLSILQASLPEAQQFMMQALPAFYTGLAHEFGITDIPDSPDHAIEWVSDFLIGRRRVKELTDRHGLLPTHVLEQAAPRFIAIFDDLPFGRQQWQRAIALLCLVLLAVQHRREQAGTDDTVHPTT